MSTSKLYKGSLDVIILKFLGENKKMYGYEIRQKIRQVTQGKLSITEGALYPALHKLQKRGFLKVSIQKVNGRSRKYYGLTKKGEEEKLKKLEELEDFLGLLTALLRS